MPQYVQFNSQGSSVSSQSSIGLGAQSPNLGGISSVSLQQPNSLHSPSSQQAIPGAAKDAGIFCFALIYPRSCFSL